MVVNEAGPLVAAAALERIGTYVGKAPEFASIEAAEHYTARSARRSARIPMQNGASSPSTSCGGSRWQLPRPL